MQTSRRSFVALVATACATSPLLCGSITGCSRNPSKADASKITLERLRGVLGKDFDSPEVKAIRDDIGEDPVKDVTSYSGVDLYSWHKIGLYLRQDREIKTIEAVQFRRVARIGDGSWPGELPEGLNFNDTLSMVKARLGDPNRRRPSAGNLGVKYTYYRKPMLVIEFDKPTRDDDPLVKIRSVEITPGFRYELLDK